VHFHKFSGDSSDKAPKLISDEHSRAQMGSLGDRMRKLRQKSRPPLHVIPLCLCGLAEFQEVFDFGLALLRLEIRQADGLQQVKHAFGGSWNGIQQSVQQIPDSKDMSG
jgi:hypothetical protein